MERDRTDASEGEAAEAHPAPQQHRECGCGRANDKFEELEPDDLVDECGQATADKKTEQEWVDFAPCCRVRRSIDVAHRHPKLDSE